MRGRHWTFCEFHVFFDGLSECTCSAVVFSRFQPAVTSAMSSSPCDCTICHNVVEHHIWSYISLSRGLMCKKLNLSFKKTFFIRWTLNPLVWINIWKTLPSYELNKSFIINSSQSNCKNFLLLFFTETLHWRFEFGRLFFFTTEAIWRLWEAVMSLTNY